MNTLLLHKEAIEFRRDRRLLVMGAVLFVLLLAAALDGWNRASSAASARAAATEADREIWVNQGANNPHGAAHFARYAFRGAPTLAAFDPGVFDYAGAAFWMEAHTQNPTTLRRAEDVAVRAPFASLSPAWVIQVVGTLVLALALYGSVATEREQGTLRSVASSGVSARTFALGKLGVAATFVTAVTVLVLAVSVLPVFASDALPLEGSRLLGLLLTYLIALLAFAFLIVWVSSLSSDSSGAFSRSAILWLTMALLWPVLAGQLATTLFPDTQEQELKNAIQLQAQTPFWVGDAQGPAVAAQEKKVLAEFGGESFESLGFDREALVLQAHEEFANAIYDELYGELNALHRRQDTVLRYASALSPLLALQRLSAAWSGTDLYAQQHFATQAEQHRRMIIEMLNRDMMIHAGDEAFAYTADRELWESIPDFSYAALALPKVLKTYLFELCVLLCWFFMAGLLALQTTRQALARGA